ncbi:MAG: MBL fold metallo-hydrolase [Bacteroidota bacterium]
MNTSDNPIVKISTGNTNVYLIRNGSSSVLIDAGEKGSNRKILQALEMYDLKPQDIHLIVLTHTHYDHTGNLKALKDLTGAQVLVHRNEADKLRTGYTPLPKGTKIFSKILVYLGSHLMKKVAKYEPVKPEILVDDQYDLSPHGLSAHILYTPGHTSGSISLILKHHDAFIGDTAFNIAGSGIYPPFADDQKELILTWNKLMDTGCVRFFPGHGRMIPRAKFERNLSKRS